MTDLTFRNNQNFFLIYNVSLWTPLYNFATSKLRMQIRRQVGDASPVYSFASYSLPGVRGSITFVAGTSVVVVTATYADVRTYMPAGTYAHDMTIEVDDPISGAPVVVRDIAAGTLVVSDGVTLQ